MLPFYNFLRKEVQFKTSKAHREALDILKTDLRKRYQLNFATGLAWPPIRTSL